MKLQNLALLAGVGAIVAGAVAACGGDDSTTIGGDGGPNGPCAAPFTVCGGLCTNTATDPGNCGACGTTCDATKAMVCSQGTCALTCGGGTTKCGSSCVDTTNDPKNCGSCGMACATGQVCAGSMCQAECPTGQVTCGAACISTKTDPNNCGGCGNVCPINNTCVAGGCVATLANTSPVLVSTIACTTAQSYRGRKVAVDPATNELFVAMLCGNASDDVQIATSNSGGVTFGAPKDLATTGISDAALVLDSAGTLYLGTISTAGALSITSSSDHGVTWGTPNQLETGLSTVYGLSMDTYKTTVYIAAETNAASVHVWHSGAGDGGTGYAMGNAAFTGGIAPFDVLLDQSTGNVWVAGDRGGVLLNAMSSDGGNTFGASNSPPGGALYMDSAMSSGKIFMAGNGDALDAVSMSAPTTDTTITGFGAGVATERAIAADSAGDLFVATHVAGGANNLVLQHVLAGGTTIDQSPVIAPGGNNPIVTSAGSNVAFVAYSSGGGVYARVMKF